MGDELLPYYNEELSHIRHMAAEFAKDHPRSPRGCASAPTRSKIPMSNV